MKHLAFGILVLCIISSSAVGQSVVSTSKGVVTFFSSAPLEDIKATNEKVRAVMNTSTGEILVRMRIQDFQFRKSLMQKHFNDDYMESHVYPEAQLEGKIINFDLPTLSASPLEVVVEGNMTIRGITKAFSTNGTIKRSRGKIVCEATFPILLEDYNVKIPRMLMRNIAETVEVTVKFELD